QAACLVAAARTLDIEVIGLQHGGHYGYSDEHTGAIEGEYACCDRFITWGWTPLPEHPAIQRQAAVPLPAPWLSARRRQWATLLSDTDRARPERPYDVLYMPNKVYPFPPAPSGSHATVNHVQAFAADLRRCVVEMQRAGLRVLHKPYNRVTTGLLADTSRDLDQRAGETYRLASTLDKGLTPELLRQCHVVVWDQPGTGLLECLTAGIPNMVLWTRLFNSETDRARGIFAELEAVGIVHRRTDSLIAEIERVKADPSGWVHAPRRADVVARFCRTYAWVDSHWARHWHAFISELARC
ncbi:MAG TPA: hypothetical protein VML96_06115, partial [Egibacteraceae bacterium]|nr:hypothetical protein [Egibacteraceae bacterium]